MKIKLWKVILFLLAFIRNITFEVRPSFKQDQHSVGRLHLYVCSPFRLLQEFIDWSFNERALAPPVTNKYPWIFIPGKVFSLWLIINSVMGPWAMCLHLKWHLFRHFWMCYCYVTMPRYIFITSSEMGMSSDSWSI